MMLSDGDIKKAITDGDITIRGFDEHRLQPASYDILLDNKFIFTNDYLTGFIDPVKKIFPKTKEISIRDDETFILHPGVSVLGSTKDYVGSDKYLIELHGKSSLARIGLIVHNTAGLINPGHYLHITLELYNLNNIPIILRPGMAIAQLTFSTFVTPPQKDYRDVGNFGAGKANMKAYASGKRAKHSAKMKQR